MNTPTFLIGAPDLLTYQMWTCITVLCWALRK